jgi:RNA-splicing ligase RtcB
MDPRKTRRDVADELIKNLMEEAPSNYKNIMPAIETVKHAGIAEPVAKLMPLLTIKG